jgi:hypothetical protein
MGATAAASPRGGPVGDGRAFPLRPSLARRHEIDLTAAALRAHKPRVPLDDARLGAVAAGELGRIRLHSVLAPPAPHDEADASRAGAA